MEQRLLANFDKTTTHTPNHHPSSLSPQQLHIALSLITNPSTSLSTLSALLKTLSLILQNPNFSAIHHHRILSLLSALSGRHSQLRPDISGLLSTFTLSPSASTSSSLLAHSLSVLFNDAYIKDDVVLDESMFLSLCFRPCKASLRHWLLRSADKFTARPSVFMTVLLGFTKDPYPYTREAALDGLVLLCKVVAVEDQSLVQGCYFRAVELLFDAEDSLRCSAVRAVSEWGRLIVACNEEKLKGYWSDVLFVQLCSVARDMSMKVRVEAFDALAKVKMVSEHILLQTLSKKASLATKDKYYPGQYTAKVFELPASSAAFTFVHGLEDEFFEAVNLLMDVLNDDSTAVRLEALETMHQMAISGHLKVQEGHLHMFLGTLADGSTVIRSAARRVLRSTRLNKSAMFKLCFECLVRNLELYPQIEPSFGGSLGFENARTVALLVLAISAPVSVGRSICTIPPRLFSYAVTLLGRISCGLIGPLSMDALLAYLSHCSQFTYVSLSEFFEGKGPAFPLMEYNVQLQTESYRFHETLQKILEAKKVAYPFLAYQLEKHEEATSYAKIILKNVKDVWPLIQYGRMDDVSRILRSWKKELMTITSDSLQTSAELAFTLQYLRIIKLLGRVWSHCMFSTRTLSSVTGELEILLKKFHRSLKEIRHSFIGLSKEDDLHILELILLSYAMEISCVRACYPSAILRKLYSTVCCIEHLSEGSSFELSTFTIDLQKMLHEIGPLTEESVENLFQLQKSLESYSLRQFVLSGTLKHVKAKLEVCNSYEHPLCFISGLPVGIAFEIKLYNMLSASRLWLKMTLEEKVTQFVFLDLDGVSGCDEIRELTFVAPFYRTPRASCFILKVCIVMECSTELVHQFNNVGVQNASFYIFAKIKKCISLEWLNSVWSFALLHWLKAKEPHVIPDLCYPLGDG